MAFSSQAKATCWSITINNPTEDDENQIQEARLKGWKVEGQLEKGENGTPHYQLMVKTPQVRGSAIKKAFTRAHIEITRNAKALEQYVHKEDTRVEELKDNDKYPSPTKLMALFAEYCNTEYKSICRRYKQPYNEMDGDQLLEVFDDCINKLIIDGYHVEAHGVNPQVRGSIKRYGQSIIFREMDKVKKNGLEEINEEEDNDSLPQDVAPSQDEL